MFFNNAELPLSETDGEERRRRADLAASSQAWSFPNPNTLDTILFKLSYIFVGVSSLDHVIPTQILVVVDVLHKGIQERAYEIAWDSFQRVAVLHLENRCRRALKLARMIDPSVQWLVSNSIFPAALTHKSSECH